MSWYRSIANGSVLHGYIVQSSANGHSWSNLKVLGTSATSLAVAAVPGRGYYFRVFTASSLGNSGASVTVHAIGRP